MAKDNEAQEEETAQEFEDEQAKEMEDVLDLVTEPAEKPADESAKKEPDQEGQPPKEKSAEETKGEGGAETVKPEPTDKGKEKEAPTDKAKAAKDDPEFEVISKDGVRNVKLSALKTTYQQHHALQTRHEAVKPIFDLSKASGIPVEQMFQFLALGIQTAYEAGNKKQAPPGATKPQEGYQGPFESEQQEKDLKETDPILYRTTKALWEQNRALSEQIVNMTGKLEQQFRAPQARPAGEPTGPAEPSPERKRVDGLIAGLQKVHDGYFKSHPERLDAFKEYLAIKFPAVPLPSVDENFMSVAFQTFDPAYHAAWQEDQVKNRLQKGRDARRRTFGETDSVRGSVASSMTEQQEHMADILDF